MDLDVAEQLRRLEAVIHAELSAGAIAVGVDGSLGHAEFARDLLGAQMLVHETQAIAFPLRQ